MHAELVGREASPVAMPAPSMWDNRRFTAAQQASAARHMDLVGDRPSAEESAEVVEATKRRASGAHVGRRSRTAG